MKIPYPIPEPERSHLIAAGKFACDEKHDPKAQLIVHKAIQVIQKRYGVKDG